jgi:hypothetical protein
MPFASAAAGIKRPSVVAPSTSSPTPLELPKTLGRYVIVRLIGEGAMGRVLLANDPVLGRDVALKLLRDDLKIPEDVRQGLVVRMRHEARAAARVMHPNIVTLHDLGEDGEIGLYLVFEYVEGPTLKRRLAEGRLTPGQVARLARELGGALSCAHRAGVVHRDVKPENVILSTTGGKIADFGIARVPDSTLTHAGGLLGTPAYSAPETFRDGQFSPESDQFSLAASLYEAISARRAFPGDDAVAVASSIATQAPRRFAEEFGLPPTVDDVLQRAMAKEPAQRFPSCDDFGLALARTLIPRIGVGPGSPASSAEPGRGVGGAVPASQPRIDEELPRRERHVGQIAIGGAVVVVTALQLLRAAHHTADGDELELPSAKPAASTAASAGARPPLGATGPSTQHRPRPKGDSTPRTDADAGVTPSATAASSGRTTPSSDPVPPASSTMPADVDRSDAGR